MNDILQQIMNMIENTRTVPSISSFSMIGFTPAVLQPALAVVMAF